MISIICPWYYNTAIVEYQLNVWNNYPEAIKDQSHFILVDDGSPFSIKKPDVELNLTMARITQDIPWNQPGARNLGAHLASTDFLLFADIDHEITADALKKTIEKDKDPDTVYMFERICDGERIRPHPCSFVIHKRIFDRIGGFDEDFSGHRGHDDSMMLCLLDRMLKRKYINGALIAHKDAITTCINRDDTVNTQLLNSKLNAVKNGTYQNGENLRFDWELVFQVRRRL